MPYHDTSKLKKIDIKNILQKMESQHELKEIYIKSCTCYNFGHIIEFEDFDLDNILINEKLYEGILVYNILYKTLIGTKSLRIIFNKIDGFTKVYYGTRYLVLFRAEKCDFIYNRIRYFI